MKHGDESLSVATLTEYCRTQAGLLSGRVETIGAEADALLDDIDEDISDLRTRLTEHASGPETPTTPSGPEGIDTEAASELQELTELESQLEEKQTLVEAKQARMSAFGELAEAYLELAAELESLDEGQTALERIVDFERDHDAPVYFEERQTLLEAVAGATDDTDN